MGLAIATALAGTGTAVVAVDVKDRPKELPGAVTYLSGDVSQPEVADHAITQAQTLSANGNVDVLVNAAGVAWFAEPGLPEPPMRDGSIADIELATWNRVVEINLTGPMLFTRAALPVMKAHGGGTIVHIASIAGLRTADGALDAYQVSKAGLVSLSRAVAAQYGQHGIRSNTVCPGAIVTPMIAGIYESDPQRRAAMANRVPLKRVGQAEDITAAVMYLVSDQASYVTGIDLIVDGGWLTTMA